MKLSAEVELDTRFGWLMRCDRVGFPKGGIAYTHTHTHVNQGPGIRYCLEGRIEIETEGSTHHYGPGEPRFESGSSPVLVPTSKETETAFVLPRSCKSRTSIRYVNPGDAAKPKKQRHKVLGERFIELPER